MRRIRAEGIAFDLDGTLISSIGTVERAWRAWASDSGFPMPNLVAFHGRSGIDIAKELVPADRVRDAARRLEELEIEYAVGVTATPGALDLLAVLPASQWAIVTSATLDVARARMRAAGVLEPAVFVTADDVMRAKPDPEPFALAAQRFGGRGTFVAFEDTSAGLTSARQADFTCVGIVGTESRSELGRHADVVIDSLEQVTCSLIGGALVLTIAEG